jgi:hypothetical protein
LATRLGEFAPLLYLFPAMKPVVVIFQLILLY